MHHEHGTDPPKESYALTLVRLLSNEKELDDLPERFTREDILNDFPSQRFLFSFRASPALQAVTLECDRIENILPTMNSKEGQLTLEHHLLVLADLLNLLIVEELMQNSESKKMVGIKNPILYILAQWEIACFVKK